MEEILRNEQAAVIEMAARTKIMLRDLDPYSPEYYLLQNDSVMFTQTAIYLQRRLDNTLPPDYMKGMADDD